MEKHIFAKNYVSLQRAAVSFPSLRFYGGLAGIFWRAGKVARAGEYSGERWADDSLLVGRLIESMGARIVIEGVENLDFDGPCVFEANHMSTLETLFLPCIIQPQRDVTFVVKRSLLSYPCLGPVLAAREPIALGRSNPREDLKIVMEEGQRILGGGRSIIIFTQGTRRTDVEPADFNTLGVKLANKDMREHLATLLSSPQVDVFDYWDDDVSPYWHRVQVEPSKYTDNGKEMQDFVVKIIDEQYNTQR